MASRTIGALVAAAGGFARTLWRVVRQVLHEVAGALFLLFAVAGAAASWRYWQRGSPEWQLALAIGYTAMMLLFALMSFRSARRAR